MESNEFVTIKRSDLIEVLGYLEQIVVSLARIGSCYSDVGKEEYEKLEREFWDKWQVWKKLSIARSKLSEPFSRDLGDDDMDELEREFQNLEYWSMKHRKPRERKLK